MAVYEVPLTQGENQRLSISLAAKVLTLTFRWNAQPEGGWIIDIGDANNIPIVQGIPMVTGADLLEQYQYEELLNGGKLYVRSDATPNAVPTFTNLGKQSHLYFVTAE